MTNRKTEKLKLQTEGFASESIAGGFVRCTTKIEIKAENGCKFNSFLLNPTVTVPKNGVATHTR